MKKLPIHLKWNTSKVKYKSACTHNMFKTLKRKTLKEYNADELYLEGNKIVIHRVKVIGTFKTKRIDGIKNEQI